MTQSSITLIASCFDISGIEYVFKYIYLCVRNMRKTWWGGSLYLPALYIRPHRIRTIVYTAACRGKHICVICSPSMCADYMCWVSCGLDRRKVYHCWHWFLCRKGRVCGDVGSFAVSIPVYRCCCQVGRLVALEDRVCGIGGKAAHQQLFLVMSCCSKVHCHRTWINKIRSSFRIMEHVLWI